MNDYNSKKDFQINKLGQIPNDWDIKRISESYEICNTLREPISAEVRTNIQGDYPYYGPTGIIDSIDHYKIDGKYVLIGEDGDHFLKYYEKSQTVLIDGKCNVNNHAHIIQGHDQYTTKWFYYFFHHRNIIPYLSRQGANRYKLNKEELGKLFIALPPKSEQETITKILSTWDQTIRNIEKLLQLKLELKKWLLQSLIAANCHLWNHERTDDLFQSISDKKHPTEELLSVTQDRGVIPRTMLEGKVMSPEGDVSAYKMIKPGDYVVSLRSFQGGLEFSKYQGLISPAYTILRPKQEINCDFFRHFFKSSIFIKKYLAIAVVGIRDGKQISYTDFSSVKLPIPPIDVQEKIAQTLNTCENEIKKIKELLTAYKNQKRGLMQKLLTGEIRV